MGDPMATVLIVDDEELLVKGIAKSLENEGYEIITAYDGKSAWERFTLDDPDLIILDIMLPGTDGLTLCRSIRSKSDTPIIMLTARGDDVDKIVGLEMGADDYIAKPFNSRELSARIKAVLRRSSRKPDIGKNNIRRGNLTLDTAKRKVFIKGTSIELTGKEFDLLLTLAESPGRVFTRDMLLEMVWGYDYLGEDRTVDVHIRRLREKIEEDPGRPSIILTKWGLGYYFNDEE